MSIVNHRALWREFKVSGLLVFDSVAQAHPQDLPQSQLHKVFGLTELSLSCLAKHSRELVSLGYITRTKDPNDSRQFRLSLSDKGLVLWQSLQ